MATRLTRDLRRSPKKAAALGILVLVAIWFWAPLLKKWVGPSGATSAKTANVLEAMPATLIEVNPATATWETRSQTDSPATRPWNEVLAWIETDERTKPVVLPEAFVSPFDRGETGTESNEEEMVAQATEPDVPDVHPRDLGLVLTSTVVGRKSRLATISGNVYRQSELIRVAETAAGAQMIEFRVEDIQPQYVTLSREAVSYRLSLHRPSLAQGNRIVVIRDRERDG